jgi:hypothetical protein
MTISMRELFSRQGIPDEVISLRHSLEKHPFDLSIGLREIHRRLLQPVDGDGFRRAGRRVPPCRKEDSVRITLSFLPFVSFDDITKNVGHALPSWIPVSGRTTLVNRGTDEVRLVPDHASETRTVEGILTVSKISGEDFPFRPWHMYYDWNFIIDVDPQYTHLLSQAIIDEPHPNWRGGNLECEWDTAFLPPFAWPQAGDRVWIVGRWIYDCGHLHGDTGKHRTEIHPPKAVASFRSEAVTLPGNNGPTQANNAVLYIGRKGGYWDQPINDQDYAFDLYLPPKPHPNAIPKFTVERKTGRLPVQPQLTPFPADNPRAFRVVIPLKGVEPHPDEYGAIISAGWSDPAGTEVRKIRHVRVSLERITFHSSFSNRKDIYFGVNGRWTIMNLDNFVPSVESDFSVELFLHSDDEIHVTACGFTINHIHRLMGRQTGTSWAEVSDRRHGKAVGEKIKDGFLSLGLDDLAAGIENDPFERRDLFSKRHSSDSQEKLTEEPASGLYELQYRIDQL